MPPANCNFNWELCVFFVNNKDQNSEMQMKSLSAEPEPGARMLYHLSA